MSARDTLTPELRAEVLRLEDDLRARVASIQKVQDAWRAEYDAARAAERTAASWEAWVDERVTLAAVAWVLTTVFVRFCEDNALVKPVWISGPRHREAIDAQQQFLRETARTNADVTDREWLLHAVDYLKSLPATAGLVDDTSPMWLVTPSGDAATRLINFWRVRDESGVLVRDLGDPDLDTRFLGDLYQEISEDAKKRYALLQTPVFVEEFILDRTLEPALNERPLEGFKMIDPTCGSGHFLLGGFQRLLDRWHKHAPGLDDRERVQAALDAVYGVDINPFAIAIARFRLTVAALRACGLATLEEAPAFKYHLAAGDSLLHGLDQHEFDLGAAFTADRVAGNFAYGTENLDLLRTILRNGQYDVVVGNPPYITVKDKSLNNLYRRLYSYCKGTYALTVPFMERFYRLAKAGGHPGWTGQITSNSFMKREFGSKLVEEFLSRVDLRLVVDSEAAWMPGHNTDGTPTVILIGVNQRPVGSTVRAVLGKTMREDSSYVNGSGPYWQAMINHLDDADYESKWLTITSLDRTILDQHPWSLSGGKSLELRDRIKSMPRRVGDVAARVGKFGIVGADQPMMQPLGTAESRRLGEAWVPITVGSGLREWVDWSHDEVLFPYTAKHESQPDISEASTRWLWPYRELLQNRKDFAGTYRETGKLWYGWHQLPADQNTHDWSISWGEVATHNHFVLLDVSRRPVKQTGLVIKLPKTASDSDFDGLIGALNTSLTCFYLKQSAQPKGGAADTPWLRTYQFNAINVEEVPLPRDLPVGRGARIVELARELKATLPSTLVTGATPDAESLATASRSARALLGRMVYVQEELDWEMYRLAGLIDEDLTYGGDEVELRPGARAFELVIARAEETTGADLAWFSSHGLEREPKTPAAWPEDYRELVERRVSLIESNPFLSLLERPENKRRWALESWQQLQEAALREWLLGRLQSPLLWLDRQGRPTPKSLAVLADEVSRDPEFMDVLNVWEGRPDVPVVISLDRLARGSAVPYLASLRLKESGLRKKSAWESTWQLQRLEDGGSFKVGAKERGGDGLIPVPPLYANTDFQRAEYWNCRGKLDVPTERFIVYPGTGREGDTTTVIGWAGWDYAQQALALATLIQSGEQQGWSEERLTPLVAGLSEVLPWVEQWHTDPDPLYGGSAPAEFFLGLLDNYMAKLGATRESLAAWRPPAATRGRKAKS